MQAGAEPFKRDQLPIAMEWARPHTGPKPEAVLKIVDTINERNEEHRRLNEPLEKVIIMVESRYYIHMLKALLLDHYHYKDDEENKILLIDGLTTLEERRLFEGEINDEESDIFIALMTLKTGGVGLNLQGANHMIFFNHQYNPAWTT